MDRPFALLRTIAPHIIILILFIAIHCRSQEIGALDSVAIEALDGINKRSIRECREYGGEIKMQPRGFKAGHVFKGGKDSVEVVSMRPYNTTVAIFHSHGCASVFHRNEEFSEIDTLSVVHHQYLITPRNRVLKFNHVDRKVYELDRHAMAWTQLGAESLVWSIIP